MKIIRIRDYPDFIHLASKWFHEKWGITKNAYLESMNECIQNKKSVPQWYVVLNDNQDIIAGAGMIENDFHDRVDLTPNLCALYVEKEYRGQRVAPTLLNFIVSDMATLNIQTLYLVTDHTSLYEKYGWEFYTMVKEDGGNQTQLYIIKNNS